MDSVRFSQDDVATFATASHDRNPLHLDASYARRTSFGRPVVFGVLGALGAMSKLSEEQRSLTRATLEFHGPIFVDVEYSVAVETIGATVKLWIRDGSRLVLRASLAFGEMPPVALPAAEAHAPRAVPRIGDTRVGETLDERWAPEPHALAALMTKFGLERRGIGRAAVAAMMAASYVVGMELPGAQALFSRLALSFTDSPELRIRATVDTFDERFRMAGLTVGLCGATGEIRALCRPAPVDVDPSRIDRALGAAGLAKHSLSGRSAVVIGGSRGLGAALSLAVARSGARVVATYVASDEAAKQLATMDQGIEVVRSNASSAADLSHVREAVGDRLDLLILSASPPVLPLSLTPATAARASEFVRASLDLVATPLAVLGSALAKDGRIIVISSTYVLEPPPDYAHYAAAKGAVEALASAFARERSVSLLVARPPRILTDMTNAAFGADDVLRAEDVAASIVTQAATTRDAHVVLGEFRALEEASG